jgi:uncharacterized membrane protein
MRKEAGATVVIVLCIAMLLFWLTDVDYQDLGFNHNRSAYLGISTMLLLIFNMILVKRKQKKQKK